ncbi:MAG: hypothetical protein KDA96_22890, partial [Planctomycetaceae bacterium]|nr:hypothetical protein [Planctomycetaceae bacterium]
MGILTMIDQGFALRLTMTLVHFLWLGTVVGLIIACLNYILRSASAQIRYLVQVSGLLAMVSCVGTTLMLVEPQASIATQGQTNDSRGMRSVSDGNGVVVLPSVTVMEPNIGGAVANQPLPSDAIPPTEHGGAARDATLSVPQSLADSTDGSPGNDSSWTVLTTAVSPYASVVVSGYLAGVLLLLIRVLLGVRGSVRLKSRSKPVTDTTLMNRFRQLAASLEVRVAPPLQ